MNVYEAIRQKRSVRQFSEQPLPDEAIQRILNAGRRAQSSKNTQPWHFIVIRNRETLQQLSKAGTYMGHVAGAALCVAFVTENLQAEDSNWIAFDVGQAAAYMQLAAHELGIGSVIGAVHQPEIARETLGLPQDRRCDVVISFGYPAPQVTLESRGGGRRPLDEIVHWDKW